jgi:hypothetical protein
LSGDEHGWNHPQCYLCWYKFEGTLREPTCVAADDAKPCCYCGRITTAGIYRRQRPGDALIAYCADLPEVFRAVPAHGSPPPPTGPEAG